MTFYQSVIEAKEYFTSFQKENYVNFFIDKHLCGCIAKEFITRLKQYFYDSFVYEENNIYLDISKYATIKKRNSFFQRLGKTLEKDKFIKLRAEDIVITDYNNTRELGKIDRTLIGYFGMLAQGIHINGYVEKNNKKYLWLSQRGNTIVDPYKYDNMVGGAISYGYSVFETIEKEAQEEASIPKELSRNANFVTKLGYCIAMDSIVRKDIVNIFNLQMSQDFVPAVNDNEVERFFLVSLGELREYLAKRATFKFNSWLVGAYFLWQNQEDLDQKEKQALGKLFEELKISNNLY